MKLTLFHYLYVIINEQQYNNIHRTLYNCFVDILILYNLNYGSTI